MERVDAARCKRSRYLSVSGRQTTENSSFWPAAAAEGEDHNIFSLVFGAAKRPKSNCFRAPRSSRKAVDMAWRAGRERSKLRDGRDMLDAVRFGVKQVQ